MFLQDHPFSLAKAMVTHGDPDADPVHKRIVQGRTKTSAPIKQDAARDAFPRGTVLHRRTEMLPAMEAWNVFLEFAHYFPLKTFLNAFSLSSYAFLLAF